MITIILSVREKAERSQVGSRKLFDLIFFALSSFMFIISAIISFDFEQSAKFFGIVLGIATVWCVISGCVYQMIRERVWVVFNVL
ncbi:hypothetical protein C2W62_45845 [Candidatus Entotheonella serta]|nr:hypothetical protein C2W62_45845 [Candidatus Entotheonella serta]